MFIRGGQKIKKFEFELAGKLPPFYMFSWFQKHKDQLWTQMGSASTGNLFSTKNGSKYKENGHNFSPQLILAITF